MALKASTSPNKDGMHTPAREEDFNKNTLNCLRRNILTSTALRPRAVNHARLCLNDTDISEISSPSRSRPNRVSKDLDAEFHPDPRPLFRRSAPHLDEIVDSMNNFNLRTMADVKDGTSRSTASLNQEFSSMGILRPSEVLTHFDATNSSKTDPYRAIMQEKSHKMDQMLRPNEISNLEMSYRSNAGNNSFDLSNFLSTSHKFTPIRPNSLPADKLDNFEFKPAESSLVKDMFEKDEEEFKRMHHPFSNQDSNITYVSPEVEIRPSWVSPEKRAQIEEKRLTIGQYFKLKSADIMELSQSLQNPDESLGYSSYSVPSLPKGARPEFIQSFNKTIDISGDDTARGTFVVSGSDSNDLDSTLVSGGVNALSVSTITRLLDNANGCDTVVENLLDMANKNTMPDVATLPSSKENQCNTPKKAASKLPRLQPRAPIQKPVTPKGVKAMGHLVCSDIKITGFQIVAHYCTLSVTVVNESADTLQCELIDMAHCQGYTVTSSAPVMLLSKRTNTLQGTIVFHHAGEIEVNVGVKSMEIRSKKKSTAKATPLITFIEPQIYLKTPYKDGIDFGLRPEDTKSTSPFEITSIGPSEIPICISIEQDSKVNGFFLMVPPENGGEMKLSTCLAFSLPGTVDRKQATTLDIGVIFLAPRLDAIPSHLKNVDDREVTLRAQLVIEVEAHEGASGLAPQERTVLAQCPIEGRIGHTQLLVSHNSLILIPCKPQEMGLKNGGLVPLGLSIVPLKVGQHGVEEETSIQIEPAQVLLLPEEEKGVTMLWNADPNSASNFNCELHLMYNNLAEDHVVTLECRTQPPVVKEKLPLRTTRPHLAWGSIRPGETCKQIVSYQNTSTDNLIIWFRIKSNDPADIPYRIFNEKEEVTTELEMHFKPLQKRNLMIMFCPTRLGPACATLELFPRHANNFYQKLIPITGYGGHSDVILKQVSTSHESLWLHLKPDFGDSVVGKFTLCNEGTIPAFVRIVSSLTFPVPSSENMKQTFIAGPKLNVTPEVMFVPARGNVEVSVKLSGVRTFLKRTPPTEMKSLAVLNITSINEVTRRRLRNLMPTLSNKDLISFLKFENSAGMHDLAETVLDGEETLVSEGALEQLADHSGASASFLVKDAKVTKLELSAAGTGVAKTLPEVETMSSFVSMLDKTTNDTALDMSIASEELKEWNILTKEVLLYFENNYKSTIQVSNYTDKELSLEINHDDRLEVSETVPVLSPFKTIVIFVSTKYEPQAQLILENGIVVYSKNDRIPVCVRVMPKPRHRMIVPPKKSLDSPFHNYPMTSSPALSTTSSSSSSSSGSSRSWHSLISGGSAEEGKSTAIYPDSNVVVFPYTAKAKESMITLTLYNPSKTTKKAFWNPPGEPFWTTNDSVEVQGNWHNYIRIYFKPTIARDVSGTLTIKVEGHPGETISVQLQGLTDIH